MALRAKYFKKMIFAKKVLTQMAKALSPETLNPTIRSKNVLGEFSGILLEIDPQLIKVLGVSDSVPKA